MGFCECQVNSDELEERLDELEEIRSIYDDLIERLGWLDVDIDDIDGEIYRCQEELDRLHELDMDALRREYERSAL